MKTLLLFSLALLLSSNVSADINKPSESVRDSGLERPAGSAGAGSCSIIYYNFCSQWIHIIGGFADEEEAGVIFDLVNDCGKLQGEHCVNTRSFWYWRFTVPTRAFNVSYKLFEVDANGCKVGPPLGTLANQDPAERWNLLPGLGSTTGDRVVLIGSPDNGTLPRFATDNNEANAVGGPNCAGIGPGIGSSVFYGGPLTTLYCPPLEFTDDLGPTNLIVDAKFVCASSATENSSWGDVKSLFR